MSVPTLVEEMRLRALGFRQVAGVDEAGRGPLAGPVVAAAVLLPDPVPRWWHCCHDSKLLTAMDREEIFQRVIDAAVWATAAVDAAVIDEIGIGAATLLAMRQAIERLPVRPDAVLVDGLAGPAIDLAQRPIVKGDRRSLAVAAASVVAKVTRDRLMVELDARYPAYGFARHKGYGTPEHLAALERLGPCPVHRRSFTPVDRS